MYRCEVEIDQHNKMDMTKSKVRLIQQLLFDWLSNKIRSIQIRALKPFNWLIIYHRNIFFWWM